MTPASGPARSFAPNPAAYDPRYLFELAIEAGLSAYAAPLGPLEVGAVTYAGEVPLILKLNSANSMAAGAIQDQAVTASARRSPPRVRTSTHPPDASSGPRRAQVTADGGPGPPAPPAPPRSRSP